MTLPITTERLELRTFQPGDLDGLHAMYGDAEVMRFIADGTPLTREQTAEALLRLVAEPESDTPGLLAAVDQATATIVGRVGFMEWEIDDVAELEIGWMIARTHQGRGLAIECGIALRDYAFDELDRSRVISVIHPDNDASVAVALRVGEHFWKRWVTPGGQEALLYRVDRSSAES